jgi:hypothetical protein
VQSPRQSFFSRNRRDAEKSPEPVEQDYLALADVFHGEVAPEALFRGEKR